MSEESDKPKDEKEESQHMPRWKMVSELYDILDKEFVEYGQDHDMTFIEMDLVLYMLNEKIFQHLISKSYNPLTIELYNIRQQ